MAPSKRMPVPRTPLGLTLLLASCASAPHAPAPRTEILLPDRSPSAVFSNGVLVGDTLYLAGRLGLDPETGEIPTSIEAEVRNIMDGLREVLGAADMTMADLVDVTVYCSDPSLYDAFNEVYASYFGGVFPARAFIGSGPLLRGAHFEVKGVATRIR